LSFEVAQFPQGDTAAEMVVAVRITTGAAERALARDFDGHGRGISRQDPSPGSKKCFHKLTTIALGSRMQRRTLLQWAASCAAVLPFQRLRLLAQPRELTPAAVA